MEQCNSSTTDSDIMIETLAAFRLVDSDKEKLNSEPAPPGTMLGQPELLDKLVGTVKQLLAESGAPAVGHPPRKLEASTSLDGTAAALTVAGVEETKAVDKDAHKEAVLGITGMKTRGLPTRAFSSHM